MKKTRKGDLGFETEKTTDSSCILLFVVLFGLAAAEDTIYFLSRSVETRF